AQAAPARATGSLPEGVLPRQELVRETDPAARRSGDDEKGAGDRLAPERGWHRHLAAGIDRRRERPGAARPGTDRRRDGRPAGTARPRTGRSALISLTRNSRASATTKFLAANGKSYHCWHGERPQPS